MKRPQCEEHHAVWRGPYSVSWKFYLTVVFTVGKTDCEEHERWGSLWSLRVAIKGILGRTTDLSEESWEGHTTGLVIATVLMNSQELWPPAYYPSRQDSGIEGDGASQPHIFPRSCWHLIAVGTEDHSPFMEMCGHWQILWAAVRAPPIHIWTTVID